MGMEHQTTLNLRLGIYRGITVLGVGMEGAQFSRILLSFKFSLELRSFGLSRYLSGEFKYLGVPSWCLSNMDDKFRGIRRLEILASLQIALLTQATQSEDSISNLPRPDANP